MNFDNYTGFPANIANSQPYLGINKEMLANARAIDILQPVTWLVAVLVMARTAFNVLRWRRKVTKKNLNAAATPASDTELLQFLGELEKGLNTGQSSAQPSVVARDRVINILKSALQYNGELSAVRKEEQTDSSHRLKQVLPLRGERML